MLVHFFQLAGTLLFFGIISSYFFHIFSMLRWFEVKNTKVMVKKDRRRCLLTTMKCLRSNW